MENAMNIAQPPQTPSEGQSPDQPVNTGDEIEKKKKAFYVKVRLAGFAVMGFIFLIAMGMILKFIYTKTKDTYVVDGPRSGTQPEQEVIITEEKPPEVEEWEIYSSDKYRFSFDYPKGDLLEVKNTSETEFSVEVFYKDIIPYENADGENLVRGYIFKVTPLKLSASDLKNAAVIKKNWFLSLCPETATVTNEYGRKVAGFDAVTVDVYDCNSDYSVTYITANDLVYEISQTYKGDVGFKQIYKSRENQILDSLVIDVDSPDLPDNIEYEDKQQGISFSYPRTMNTECCKVPAPLFDELKNPITIAENDNSDALGVFYTYKLIRTDFNEVVEEQKAKLTDEYKVVKNKTPNGTQTEIDVAGQKAVMLSGYSWKGNDLILIPHAAKNNILIISKTNISEETFKIVIESLKLN